MPISVRSTIRIARVVRRRILKCLPLIVIPAKAGIQCTNIEKMKSYHVYILSNKRNGTLYIGITNNLERRVYEHKNNLIDGFTKKYQIHKLVYCEATNDVVSVLQREKELKKWSRSWKIRLIEKENKNWDDLAKNWIPAFPLRVIPAKAGIQ